MGSIWLASFPRSGNTLLRTILWQCFELRSDSVYENDLGGNARLGEYAGHIEHAWDKHWFLRKTGVALTKTHAHAADDVPAIYVIRDGRAASVSLFDFYAASPSSGRSNGRITLEDAIEGRHWAGSWTDHVRSWNPWERPNTLLLRYEDLVGDLPATLDRIGHFIDRDIVNDRLPDRAGIAGTDGQWVRNSSNWRSRLSTFQLARFNELNREVLERAGYRLAVDSA